MNEDEIRKSIDEYSQKSEDELMTLFTSLGISPAEFDAFAEMIMPMLTPEQAHKLRRIREESLSMRNS